MKSTDPSGATVVITHRIEQGGAAAYEAWLARIGPVCRSYPGHLDWQIIRPIPGLSGTYTVVIRFDSQARLEQWMFSEDRKRFVEELRPLLADEDRFQIRTGLDIWFAPEGNIRPPMRWKQALITWVAIFPLVVFTSMGMSSISTFLGIEMDRYVRTLIESGIIVLLMAYVVMPPFTRMLRNWLFA